MLFILTGMFPSKCPKHSHSSSHHFIWIVAASFKDANQWNLPETITLNGKTLEAAPLKLEIHKATTMTTITEY